MTPDINNTSNTEQSVSKTQKRLDRLAWLLDSVIPLPGGLRLGVDGLIGLVPVVGDAATALLSTYIVGVGVRSGASKAVIFKMIANVLIDTLLGAVPFLGDFFDIAHRSNSKNTALIQQYLEQPNEVKRSSALWVAGVVIGLLLMLVFALWLVAALIGWVIGLF